MADGIARIRLRSIRWKDGRAPVRVFRTPEPSAEVSNDFAISARRCAEGEVGGSAMVGFAIVAWASDGKVYVNYSNSLRSPLLGAGVGQYAKDVIQAEQAVRWSRD